MIEPKLVFTSVEDLEDDNRTLARENRRLRAALDEAGMSEPFVPYKPENHVGALGWLWASLSHTSVARWRLISTHDDDDGTGDFSICLHGLTGPTMLYREPAREWIGHPYVPCTPPNCTPSITTAKEG